MANSLLSTRKLNQIRALNEKAMPDLVTLFSPTETNDGRGGVTTTFTEVETVICRFRPKADRQDAPAGGATDNATLYQVTMPYDTVLTNKYRLRRDDIDYEIVGDVSTRSYMVGLRVTVKRVR